MDTREHKDGTHIIDQQNKWNKTAPPTNPSPKFSTLKPNIRVATDAVPSNSSGAIPSFIAPVGQRRDSVDVGSDSDLSQSNENSEQDSSPTSDSESRHSDGCGNGINLPPKRPLKLIDDDNDMCPPSSVNPPGGQRHAVAAANSAVSRRRTAARNVVTYSELAPGSSEEDGEEDSPSQPKGRGQRNSSDSEFVMSEGEQGLNDAAESSSDDEEEDEEEEEEYRPTYRKKASTKKSKVSGY